MAIGHGVALDNNDFPCVVAIYGVRSTDNKFVVSWQGGEKQYPLAMARMVTGVLGTEEEAAAIWRGMVNDMLSSTPKEDLPETIEDEDVVEYLIQQKCIEELANNPTYSDEFSWLPRMKPSERLSLVKHVNNHAMAIERRGGEPVRNRAVKGRGNKYSYNLKWYADECRRFKAFMVKKLTQMSEVFNV